MRIRDEQVAKPRKCEALAALLANAWAALKFAFSMCLGKQQSRKSYFFKIYFIAE